MEYLRLTDAVRALARAQGTVALKSEQPLDELARLLPARGVTSEAEIGPVLRA